VKLLIIADPYESDRLRRAAVRGGIEAVAVGQGESLSGWITATRPDLIVLAPQIVSADPNVALAKVRSVPRGRVPIFLVGAAATRSRLTDLADGFFVQPLDSDDLLARARIAIAGAPRPGDVVGSGPHAPAALPQPRDPARTPTLKPLVAAREGEFPVQALGERDRVEATANTEVRVPRKTSEQWPPARPVLPDTEFDPPPLPTAAFASGGQGETSLFAALAANIDAEFDAAIRDVVREVDSLRHAQSTASEAVPKTAPVPASESSGAIDPLAALIVARHRLVQEGDYFQVLNVSRAAGPEDIEKAYQRLMTELSGQTSEPDAGSAMEAQLLETRIVATEAARLLMDDGLREQYRAHLPPSPSSPPLSSDSESVPR
jgi:hypothetical protein